MTKKEIAHEVALKLRTTDLQGLEAVQAVLDVIAAGLSRGERIELRRFGVFEPGARRARIGRNPRTGEPVAIDASRFVRFRASGEIEAAIPVEDAA